MGRFKSCHQEGHQSPPAHQLLGHITESLHGHVGLAWVQQQLPCNPQQTPQPPPFPVGSI